jgi:hypothetical protein
VLVEESRRGTVGPMEGTQIVELVGTGPGPFAAMVLADAATLITDGVAQGEPVEAAS